MGISLLQDIQTTIQLFTMQVALVLLSIAAFAAAAPANSYDYKPAAYPAHQTYDHKPAYNHKEYDYAPAYYQFDYAVKDDYTYVDMGHSEARMETTPRDNTSSFFPT